MKTQASYRGASLRVARPAPAGNLRRRREPPCVSFVPLHRDFVPLPVVPSPGRAFVFQPRPDGSRLAGLKGVTRAPLGWGLCLCSPRHWTRALTVRSGGGGETLLAAPFVAAQKLVEEPRGGGGF